MTGPSRADVGAMANLLKALNGDKNGLKAQTEAQQSQGGNEIVDVSPGVKFPNTLMSDPEVLIPGVASQRERFG